MFEKESFLRALGPLEQQIVDYIEPILALEHCELVAIKLSGLKGRPNLALFLDRSSLDELSHLSRLVSNALDVANAESNWFQGTYQLELSSPGLDRPLTKKSHFLKSLGETIRVKTTVGTLRGILKKADLEKGIWIEGYLDLIAWQNIQNANTVYIGR